VDTLTEPLCILGAMLTGRPVRYVFGREEEMQYGPPRGAERIYIKDGVMRDGRIVARKIRAYFDSGAYTRLSSYAAVKCAAHLPGPYTIPNVYGDVYCVFTNRTPATAMRGFGVTAMDFAIECQMDKLAHLVGMDPMEFRILNAYRDGDMKAHRREAKNTALIECVQVAWKGLGDITNHNCTGVRRAKGLLPRGAQGWRAHRILRLERKHEHGGSAKVEGCWAT
jgi:CO/xanthine dehydrogenase Mo-binding subunit